MNPTLSSSPADLHVLNMYLYTPVSLSSLSARPPPSRAEGRRRSLALPFKRTAAKRRQALKMTPTQSEGRGVFHIVRCRFSQTQTHTSFLYFWYLLSTSMVAQNGKMLMKRIAFTSSSDTFSCSHGKQDH